MPRLQQLLESWHIHSEQNPMNRERGLLLRECCMVEAAYGITAWVWLKGIANRNT